MKYVKNILQRKLNGGTPLNNFSNQVIHIDQINKDILDTLLSNTHSTDGLFGFEHMISDNQSKLYLFCHPLFNMQQYGIPNQTHLGNLRITEQVKIQSYTITLEHPSLFPINHQIPFDFFTLMDKITEKLHKSTRIFSQMLLCKRKKDWQSGAISQYEDYLKGNDYPADNEMIRRMQNGILNVLQERSEKYQREFVTEIESKIIDDCFRFEMRLLIFIEDKLNDEKFILNTLKKELEKLSMYNSMIIHKHDSDYLYNQVIHRKLTHSSHYQYLSKAELMALLTSDIGETVETETVEVEEDITVPTIVNHSQQNLIDMLPTGKKKNREIDYSIIEDIEKALKRVKVIKNQKIETHNISLGSTLQRVTIKIPTNVNYSDILKSHKNIKAELGYESFSIEQGEEPGTVSFIIPCNERDVVYLRELLENEEFLKFADEALLPFIAGMDEMGNLNFGDLVKTPHLLIAGATGSGKSKFITQLILLLLILRKPSEMIMYLIDPKKVEFSLFHGFPHVKEVVTEMNEAKGIFKSLVAEMEKRYDIFSKHGVKNLVAYNKKIPDKALPFIVCCVDEYADLVMTNPEVEDYIERMGQKARGAGIHLIVATQKPSATIIGGSIKANMPSKISFKLDSSSDYRTVFGKGIGYHLLGQGDGVMRLDGQTKEFIRFQSPIITLDDEEEEKLYERIKKAYKGESVEGIDIVEEDEPIDKLKRVIAISGETRISQLQKEMGVRINTVQELMQQLVEEGWLIKHTAKSKGYELVASEDELEKWRLH
jgi:S-DNA-T family DNA segregation ATPase FtsK/SpoIIIE